LTELGIDQFTSQTGVPIHARSWRKIGQKAILLLFGIGTRRGWVNFTDTFAARRLPDSHKITPVVVVAGVTIIASNSLAIGIDLSSTR